MPSKTKKTSAGSSRKASMDESKAKAKATKKAPKKVVESSDDDSDDSSEEELKVPVVAKRARAASNASAASKASAKSGGSKKAAPAKKPAKKKVRICWSCEKNAETDGVTLLKCYGCRRARYCDVECQSEDWEYHREYCQAIQERRAQRDQADQLEG